ncbi:MAG: YIP1 family protein [Chloroflexota bacterium]|nr:YIP1 family protein [Chloroflexota bacterium]MDE2839044.1 YIP1 family protein [Chloroflexota bacterium]MDE2929589.1 YIP1 family protein [Chloroflexota bacterium]
MLVNRMIRAAMLDPRLYEEVEHDRSATSQAVQVVIIVALATGIGGALSELFSGDLWGAASSLVAGVIVAVFGWLLWAFVTYLIGTGAFGGTATYGEMLRTLGFAQSAKILLIAAGILGWIPLLGGVIWFIVQVWVLLAVFIAIRQALDVNTIGAALTAIIGWAILLVAQILAGMFGLGFVFLGSLF